MQKGVQEDEIELDIDELSNDVLFKLLNFVRKYAPLPTDSPESRQSLAPASATVPRPKKNKPMSKVEQEAKIQEIRGKLSGFENPGSSPEPSKQYIVINHKTILLANGYQIYKRRRLIRPAEMMKLLKRVRRNEGLRSFRDGRLALLTYEHC